MSLYVHSVGKDRKHNFFFRTFDSKFRSFAKKVRKYVPSHMRLRVEAEYHNDRYYLMLNVYFAPRRLALLGLRARRSKPEWSYQFVFTKKKDLLRDTCYVYFYRSKYKDVFQAVTQKIRTRLSIARTRKPFF